MTTEDPITHACRLLREAAKELACCVSIDGATDWANEPEAKAAYDEHMYAALALEQWASAIGAGGVSGPLLGQPQAMPDLSELTERGAVAWAGVDAQGLREGGADMSKEREAFIRWHMDYLLTDEMLAAHVWDSQHRIAAAWQARASLSASAGGEPVAYAVFAENGNIRVWATEPQHVKRIAAKQGLKLVKLYTHPSPTSAEGVEHG